MADEFNPYYTFLGLDEELASPNFYQLLRLREQEEDLAKIQAAADKASTRVRAHRPGEHAAQWSGLLDEIQAARTCLLDPSQRQAYDQKLGNQSSPGISAAPSSQPPNPAAFAPPAMTFVSPPQPNFAYPPGVGPAPSYGSAVHPQPAYVQPQPSPVLPPAAWAPALPTADPMTPMSLPPGASGPMAPVSYAWTTMPPAGPTLAPPVAGANPGAFDPMAPVAFPGRSEPLVEPRPRIVGFAGGASIPGTDTYVPFATAAAALPQGVATVPVAHAVVVPALGGVGVPTPGVSTRPIAKRRDKLPLLLVLGTGCGIALLVALIVWSLNGGPKKDPLAMNDETKSGQPPVAPHEQKPPVPMPVPSEQKPKMAEPDPMPEPEPTTVEPEPAKPEVNPEPEPVKPEPKPMPSAAELAELSRRMKEAKTALGDFGFDEAESGLGQAEKLAKLPEHQAMVFRLKSVADMARQFRQSIQKSMASLETGEEIKVGKSILMIVVESSPEKVVLRRDGESTTYALSDLPLAVAISLGERGFSEDDPKTKLFKAAYVFVDKRSDPAQLARARTWWDEAQLKGVDVTELLPVLSDTYDFASEDSPK